eukprot:1159234-Pelagomonas_calceolata.AAC.8
MREEKSKEGVGLGSGCCEGGGGTSFCALRHQAHTHNQRIGHGQIVFFAAPQAEVPGLTGRPAAHTQMQHRAVRHKSSGYADMQWGTWASSHRHLVVYMHRICRSGCICIILTSVPITDGAGKKGGAHTEPTALQESHHQKKQKGKEQATPEVRTSPHP